MKLEKLREELIEHEGYRQDIYICPAGKRTVGIGHLIVPANAEWHLPVGSIVKPSRVEQLFQQDMKIAALDCINLYGVEFLVHPNNVQRVLMNMAFNLGFPRLFKFERFNAAIRSKDYTLAAKEGKDSKWYFQVGNRSRYLMNLLAKA